MVEINIDIEKLKKLPLRLRVVGAVIAIDMLFLAAAYMVLDDLMAERVARVEELRGSLSQVRKQNADLRREVEEYPMLRHTFDQAMAEGISAPLDRLKLVQRSQDWSDHHHLINLRYRMALDTAKAETSQKYHVEQNRIVYENEGLIDTDVLSFWHEIVTNFAGHYRVAEFTLERQHEIDPTALAAIRHGSILPMVKAKIDVQWIGVQPNVQEGQ